MGGYVDANGYFHDDSGYGTWYAGNMDPAAALQQHENATGAQFGGGDAGANLSTPYQQLSAPTQSSPNITSTSGAAAPTTNTNTSGANSATDPARFSAPTKPIRLRNMSTGQEITFQAGQYTAQQIDAPYLRNGWTPVNDNGDPYTIVPFEGGQMFFDPETGEAQPLNVLMGGEWGDNQKEAVERFKQDPLYQQTYSSWQYWKDHGKHGPPPNQPPQTPGPTTPPPPPGTPTPTTNVATPSSPGNPLPSTGGVGNATTNPNNVQLPDDWQDILKFLTNTALNRSLGSNGLIDLATGQLTNAQNRVNQIDAKGSTIDQFITSMMDATKSNDQWRNDIINQMLFQHPDASGNLTPGLLNTANQLLSKVDEAPGMSPEGKAAMMQQLNKDIPGQFDDALSSAYSELSRRGALGGELPGSQADLSRTLAPIYAARSSAYSNAQSQGILANENLKIQQQLSNRSNAVNTLGQLGGLIGTMGSIYDPTKYAALTQGGINAQTSLINAGTSALGAGTDAVNAATGAYTAGNQPLSTAAQTGGALAANQPTSFKNLLMSSLFSTGLSNSSGIIDLLKKIPWGKVIGAAGGTDDPSGNAFNFDNLDWGKGLGSIDWNNIQF